MRVLIACEFSGIIREAFSKKGHETYSCDLDDTEIPGLHLKCDVREIIHDNWDLIIAHPPCTHLAISGARWFKDKREEQIKAIEFFMLFAKLKGIKLCIENPVSIMSTHWKKPTQIIQPYQFGHPEEKKTCLWLKNLPKLKPTKIVPPGISRIHYMPRYKFKSRAKERSRTYTGIAEAMANQWG